MRTTTERFQQTNSLHGLSKVFPYFKAVEFSVPYSQQYDTCFKSFVPRILSTYGIKTNWCHYFNFNLYIARSLHVSGPQAHPQESSHSCSHNHWFSVCTALAVCSVRIHTKHAANWCHCFNCIYILPDLYMFRAHRPILRRVHTAVPITIGSVSVLLWPCVLYVYIRSTRPEQYRHWTNGCVNSCVNSPEDGPVGPKHVEIRQYINTIEIVTSVGFYSIWHLSLTWFKSIRFMPSQLTSSRHILILSSHQRLGLPSCLLPTGFSTKYLQAFLFSHLS